MGYKGLLPILLFILLLHGGALFLRLFGRQALPPLPTITEAPLKVKILHDTVKQIVQSEDSEDARPKDEAFLSDKDRSFDRQTRARTIDKFKQGKPRKKMSLSDLGKIPEAKDPFLAAAKAYAQKKRGDTSEEIQAEEDVSSTNDHVEDVPLGDLTHLNTAEYKFYGFYHRIRQRLEQFWGASIQEKAKTLAKEGRHVAEEEDLITSLQIVLDDAGRIVAIRVLGSSGVKELDEAAVESFNDAGPFPNPPKEMIKNGHVTLEWGFVVKT